VFSGQFYNKSKCDRVNQEHSERLV
jgi:hypothetical protein